MDCPKNLTVFLHPSQMALAKEFESDPQIRVIETKPIKIPALPFKIVER